MIQVTHELILAASTGQGARKKLELIGVGWPLKKGWKDLALKNFVCESDAELLLAGLWNSRPSKFNRIRKQWEGSRHRDKKIERRRNREHGSTHNHRGKFKGGYHAYIQSRQWGRKRKKAREFYGNRCTICGSTEKLQVHHRHYKTLFSESMDDLDLLCDGCHRNEHEGKVKGVVDPITERYLALNL